MSMKRWIEICDRRELRGKAFSLAVLLLLMFSFSCATPEPKAFRLMPAALEPGADSSTLKGLSVTARQLGAEELGSFLSTKGYGHLNNILPQLGLLVLSSRVDNGTGNDILLEPRFITFADGKNVYLMPLDYAKLYSDLPAGPGRKRFLDDLQHVTFDRPVTIKPGRWEERLLLFYMPEKIGKSALLSFTGLYAAGESGVAAVEFVRVYVEE